MIDNELIEFCRYRQQDSIYRDEFRQLADEIERLTEATKLKEGLKEALEWNWCDDDYPENLYYELSQLCKDDDELREILADRVSDSHNPTG